MNIGVQHHLLFTPLQGRLNRLYLLAVVRVDPDETFVEFPQFNLLHRKLFVLRMLAPACFLFPMMFILMVLPRISSQYRAGAALWDLDQGFLQEVLFEVGRSLDLLDFVPLVQPETIARARPEWLRRVELRELRFCFG